MARPASSHAGTLPYWTDSASISTFQQLDADIDVDVVVVGAGITGLTAAYLLALSGKSVALLERDRCALVDTGHTTAHVTMVTDRRLHTMERDFGRTHAQAVWDAGLAAIAQIDEIIREHEIDCGFEWVDGYLHSRDRQPAREEVAEFEEDARLATALGFDATFLEEVPGVGSPGIRFDNQARFHPRRYLSGLAKAARDTGVRIFEHSEVEEFTDEPLRVTARGHSVRARDIVIATHNPLVGVSGIVSATAFQTKLALYTSYVVAGRVPRDTIPDALFWDTGDPYQYLRLDRHRDHDVVIFGGEDHKTGQASDTNAPYARLERAITTRIPQIELTHRWSGQVIETPDGLPYIGRMADHQYAATGFGGNGMTFGTLAGMIIADAIAGRVNPWAELFDPDRMAVRRGLWDYITENSDYPYYMLRDRFAGAAGKSVRAVRRGQGKVIEHSGAKVAAYRSPDGALSLRSAVCTHMGCLVAWNDAERTWDCPCHGSRFTTEGDVISGPAETPLADVAPDQESR